MDILKSFVIDNTDHKVNVRWENDKPFFRANEIGEILGLTNVRATIRNFDSDEKTSFCSSTMGGDQDTVFLTEEGLYRLLMISRKPIARPFQKWVTKVLISIRETGKYELDKCKQEIEIQHKKLLEAESNYEALKKEAELFKSKAEDSIHSSYIEAFSNKYVVYFGKIKKINIEGQTKWLVKIGSTKQINVRAEDLEDELGDMHIFKVFECPCNEMFEKFLHNHPDIRRHIYNEKIYNNHKSHEVFALDDEEIKKAIRIAVNNVHKYRKMWDVNTTVDVQKIKLEQLKEIKDIIKFAYNLEKPGHDENLLTEDAFYVDPIILHADARQYTQAKGPKIQRYSRDGRILLETYVSAIYAVRDKKLDSPCRNGINEAVELNTEYKDFRWAFLDRSLPDDTVQVLEPTVEKPVDVRKGYVAMLNLDKTRIVEVFANQVEAKENRKLKSPAAICKAIKKGTPSSGHYFMLWYDCADDLKTEYLKTNVLPDLIVANGTKVEKLHPITEEVLHIYPSVAHVIKDYKFSRDSLSKVIKNKQIAKGYKWRWWD